MKVKIVLFPNELEMAQVSMSVYREGLSHWNKCQFDIAYKKVMKAKRVLELDGMEMEFVLRALRSYGWHVYKYVSAARADTYFELAVWLNEKKENFHNNNLKIKTDSAENTTCQVITI
jgi:hypothetical protein